MPKLTDSRQLLVNIYYLLILKTFDKFVRQQTVNWQHFSLKRSICVTSPPSLPLFNRYFPHQPEKPSVFRPCSEKPLGMWHMFSWTTCARCHDKATHCNTVHWKQYEAVYSPTAELSLQQSAKRTADHTNQRDLQDLARAALARGHYTCHMDQSNTPAVSHLPQPHKKYHRIHWNTCQK